MWFSFVLPFHHTQQYILRQFMYLSMLLLLIYSKVLCNYVFFLITAALYMINAHDDSTLLYYHRLRLTLDCFRLIVAHRVNNHMNSIQCFYMQIADFLSSYIYLFTISFSSSTSVKILCINRDFSTCIPYTSSVPVFLTVK